MPKRRAPNAEKKALRRVEQARASYARAENKVGDLRLRLDRAEKKLAQRAARLSDAQTALIALAVPAPAEPPTIAEGASGEPAPITTTSSDNGASPASHARSRRKTLTPDGA